MNNEISVINNDITTMWDNKQALSEIRKLFAPKLNDMEFQFFVGLGKATKLNPFTRELWSIKYQDNMPAQVFIGRDGYRKAAQAHPDYDYHQADAVYEGDKFQVTNGEIQHSYQLKDRGKLVGAYCLVKRKSASKPIYVFVDFYEYDKKQSVWKEKPATMIKKVAEAQALRATFQDILGGTYTEEEFDKHNDRKTIVIEGKTQTEKLKSTLNIQEAKESEDIIEEENEENNNEPITLMQISKITTLMNQNGFDNERRQKAFDYFKIDELEDLNQEEAKKFIMQLERL